MQNMGGAYGGQKAGGNIDIMQFAQRPLVVLRMSTLIISIVIFASVSSQGYAISPTKQRYCLYNENPNACNYGVGVGVVAFLASCVFLVGEYLFEQMSSVKSRKHYVLADIAFHSLWSFMFFIGFCYLTNQWSASAEPPIGYSSNSVKAAIVFCMFGAVSCGITAYLAYERFRLGVDVTVVFTGATAAAATAGYGAGGGAGVGAAPYDMGTGNDQYNEVPFSGNVRGQGMNEFQAPQY